MAFVRNPNNIIPIMTSNTSPSGYIASASSEFSSSYAAWKAFNGSNSAGSNMEDSWMTQQYTTTGWLAIELPTAKVIDTYTIAVPNWPGITRKPVGWTFDGWNGSAYVTLQTVTAQYTWPVDVSRTYICSNATAYKKYRINVTEGGTDGLFIGEFELIPKLGVQPFPITFF